MKRAMMPLKKTKDDSVMLNRKFELTSARKQGGMTTTEYAIAGALVGVAIILAFTDMGNAIAAVINFLAEAIN